MALIRFRYDSVWVAGILFLVSFCRCVAKTEPSLESTKAGLALETFDIVWQKIHEHHFDTNFNGHDWLKVREQYRPRAAAARNQKELRETMQEMIDLLHVSHMAIVPGDFAEFIEPDDKKDTSVEKADEEDSGTIGLEVRFQGSTLIVTRVEPGLPGALAGVKAGWLISRIGSVQASTLLPPAAAKVDQHRREFLAWKAASKKLAGSPGSNLEIEFLNERDSPVSLRLKRVTAQGEAIQFGSLPPLYAHLASSEIRSPNHARIGLIRFNIWMLPTALAFNKAIDQLRPCDGMIIDLRGNIGGMVGMIIGVAGHFMNEPVSLGALLARDNTFQLPANPRFVDSSGKPVDPFARPVAILVDEITASASEVFTGGLQELGRVRVFGRVTSGQALPAVLEELPNGDAFYHPIADFITPKGDRFEGRGVIPDEAVPLDRRDLLSGMDLTLDRAIIWLQSKANPK